MSKQVSLFWADFSISKGNSDKRGGRGGDGKSNKASAKTLCNFFALGGCRFGAKCKFSHDVGGSDRGTAKGEVARVEVAAAPKEFVVYEALDFVSTKEGYSFKFNGWVLPEQRKLFDLFVPLGTDHETALRRAVDLRGMFPRGALFTCLVKGEPGVDKVLEAVGELGVADLKEKVTVHCGSYGMGILDDGRMGLVCNINSPGGRAILWQVKYFQGATKIEWLALAASFRDDKVPPILFAWGGLAPVEKNALAGENFAFWTKWCSRMPPGLTRTVRDLEAAIYNGKSKPLAAEIKAQSPAGPLQFAGGQFDENKDENTEETFKRELKEEVQMEIRGPLSHYHDMKLFGQVELVTNYFVGHARRCEQREERVNIPQILLPDEARRELSPRKRDIFDKLMILHMRQLNK
jgi:hypothetical protein